MIYGLLIETATERGLVALSKNDQLLEAVELPFGYQNSKTLLPAIDLLLKNWKLIPTDLSFIAVGAGPGSYTGLRVGVAAAKGLCFACHLPVIALSTLDAFLPEKGVAIIDAKIGGAYILHPGEEVKVLPLEQIKLNSGTRIVTPQANSLRKKWEKLYPNVELVWEEKGPNPERMVRLAWAKWEKKEYSREGEVEILYLRKTQAEIEREQKNG